MSDVNLTVDQQLDVVFDRFDDFMLTDRFDLVDAEFKNTSVDAVPVAVSVGMLCITACEKDGDKFKERESFKARLELKLLSSMGLDKMKELLGGL